MGDFIWIGNQDIIQVGVDAAQLPECLIDESLKGLSGVAKSERHPEELKLAEGCDDRCFGYVFFGPRDLVVCLDEIDFREHLHAV